MAERRGKGGTPRSRNQGWWTEELTKAVGGEAGSGHDRMQDRAEHPPTSLYSY